MVEPQGRGASVPDQALVASDGAASVSTLTGFDPSRWRAESYEGKPRHLPKDQNDELGRLVNAARGHIKSLPPERQELLYQAAVSVSPINCGWQHYALAEAFVYELHAIATEARRAETGTGSVHDGAAPSGDRPSSSGDHQ